MKEDYKAWPIRWTKFPKEHFTTNWLYENDHNCLEVIFNTVSTGLIPINQIELQKPDGQWTPLIAFIDKCSPKLTGSLLHWPNILPNNVQDKTQEEDI